MGDKKADSSQTAMNFENVKGTGSSTYMPGSNKTNRSFLAALGAEISMPHQEKGKGKRENGEYQKKQRLFASFAALSR